MNPQKRTVKKVIKKVNPSTARSGKKKIVIGKDGKETEIDVATEEEFVEE
eukprot:CAMPEP_0176402646 /NCGR_PEP_ID=MMETSP0126-20121128/49442_1 /TAXON_ID=141414 ORGANISM="Strombidinopsis acuminatum, Strain SPMC142" /NCGR_SAMPLE_ID=MMETSP0126 /ASSEMBLY_ACC=CAM_ASM_000229 /LENGTH=49 /DNA_ID=CAMNT_0017780383 /DNA_START=323 /DNA_END=472 /DNA_ORIENTATION=+